MTSDWGYFLKDEFQKPYFIELKKLVDEEYQNHKCYPPYHDILNALKLTNYQDVKIVILGQDPYHNEGEAMGLSFSVKKGVTPPPSLRNIFKELYDDLGIIPETSDLTKWAKKGVLLLNSVLTVRENMPGSHKDLGWETFTDHIITLLSQRKEPIVFILWGNYAKSKKKLIDLKRHYVIESAHPSPLSAYHGFFGSKPFSRANAILEKVYGEKVSFDLGDDGFDNY